MAASLSLDRLARYRSDGFVFPVPVMSAAEAESVRSEMEAIERRHGPLHYLPKAHLVLPLADRLARHPALLDAVESIIGPDILLWDSTFIIKEPGDGKRVSWHQDLTYWGLEPPDVASIWLALSPARVENGAMRMIPGTQSGPLQRHRDTHAPDNILSRGQEIDAPIEEGRAVDIVLDPGTMSLHHGRVWHGSNPNRSGERRIAFNAQYLAPWVRQVVGPTDWAMLVRGEDRFGHFEREAPPADLFRPEDVARQKDIAARRAAYLHA